MFAFVSIVSLALPLLSAAQLVPTGPGSADSFKQGSPCTTSWTADTSGKWKNTFIELMTGPNQPMVHLATVANVDGTDPTKTSISFPCPSVSPNAAIYFYQFTAQGQNTTWTTRFTISDPSGATSSPPNATQPDGEAIPWGTGKLLDSTQGSPPPPTAPAGQIDGSGSGSGAQSGQSSAPVLTASGASSSSSILSATAGPSSNPVPSAAQSISPSGVSTVRVAASTTAASTPSSAPASTGSSSPNGARAIATSVSAVPALVAAAALGLFALY
ncbi:hypothetical protein JB92DRAFT_36669 [Gautieria morchelliformis]|nr:hypothetical protein JB92DRAFT_36669 [Gautieria morchelliformis]